MTRVPIVWFCAVLLLLAGQVSRAQQLPAGPGADVLKARCISCHDADIITSQKLSLTGWTNSVSKMIRWGAQVTPDERAVLQPYLAMHFAAKPAASHAVDAAKGGPATYERACLVCHDADIISQQKLTAAGWTNSVNKMIRWGAAVPDAEKQALIDYLAAQFPRR